MQFSKSYAIYKILNAFILSFLLTLYVFPWLAFVMSAISDCTKQVIPTMFADIINFYLKYLRLTNLIITGIVLAMC